MIRSLLCMILAFTMIGFVSALLPRVNLNDWEFKVAGKFEDKYYPAKVPSTIHLDLLDHKLIPDPFEKNNAQSDNWLDKAQVEYRTSFKMPAEWKSYSVIELILEGIDTYADIHLNGQKIQETNNSFVKYTVRVPNDKLQFGVQNSIVVKFNQSQAIDAQRQSKDISLPFAYGHTRKAAYQYGWDWAPSQITVGIWKPIYFVAYNTAKIDYVWIRNKMLSEDTAVINIAAVLKVKSLTQRHELVIKVDGDEAGRIQFTSSVGYKDIEIKQPKFWWPRNVGKPNVYNFSFTLISKGTELDEFKQVYGIRTVHLNTTKGAFQFIVNGYPVYAKGGNYVPPDMFYPRFSNPKFTPGASLKHYMDTIEQSNYNMIRVWGGGQYESDEFYEECTRRGIMIFQDFMFSVNIYPGNEPFLRNSEIEIKQQVRRLRNYACIALWSGNNEILQGILAWGWGREDYRKNYDLLFEKLIRKILEIESPDISYIPSSPQFGSGYSTTEGDIHSWSVWAAGALFDSYERTIGRFNSQFGTQAFPAYETIEFFAPAEDRKYDSPIMRFHEKHNSGFSVFQNYIRTYMHQPTINFEMEVYQSGLVQAYGVGVAIAAHRIKKAECWGTLYWQFNDAWPGISWASMDYFGRWKPLQYYARRMYMDVAVFFKRPSGDSVTVYVVNDKLYDVDCLVILKVVHTNGTVLFNETKRHTVKSNQALEVHNYPAQFVKEQGDTKSLVFYGEVISSKENIMRNTYYLGYFKEINLKKAKLTVKLNVEKNEMVFTSDVVLKSLYIGLKEGKYLKVSDNYFDIIPGISYLVTTETSLASIKDRLQFASYRESHINEPLEVEIS